MTQQGRVAELARRLFGVVLVDVLEWRSTEEIPHPGRVDGVAIHRLTREDSRWRNMLSRKRAKPVKSFFARGDLGYVATIEGNFAGWIWLSRVSHRDRYSGLHIRIAPDEAYAYGMLVEEPYRQLGIAGVLMSTLLSDVQSNPSLSRVYGWVDCRNREMQLLSRMMFGFTPVQRVRRVHLPRVGWQVPYSDSPRFGPVSRVGRHSNTAQA